MTNYKEIFKKVKDHQPASYWDVVHHIVEELSPDGHSDYSAIQRSLKAIPIRTWLCSDTIVGTYAIVLNGVMVGHTAQYGRKSPIGILFFNDEMFKDVKNFIDSHITRYDDDSIDYISESTGDNSITQIGESLYFSVNYASNILHEYYDEMYIVIDGDLQHITSFSDVDESSITCAYAGDKHVTTKVVDVYLKLKSINQ